MPISEHKPRPEPVRRIAVFTGAGRRRSGSAEEKAAIIPRATAPAKRSVAWLAVTD